MYFSYHIEHIALFMVEKLHIIYVFYVSMW